MNAYAETIKIIGFIVGGGLFASIATILVARMTIKKERDLKKQDGDSVYNVKLIDDRAEWVKQVLEQYEALRKKVTEIDASFDGERLKRMALEELLHKNNMKQEAMQKQIEVLILENEKAIAQIVKLNEENVKQKDENRQRKDECEEQIRLLHDELVVTKKERDEYKTRLHAILMTQNIGAMEHMSTVGDDTNLRVKQVERKVDDAASLLKEKESKEA